MIKPTKTTNQKLDASLVKGLAEKLGFDDCGISSAQVSNADKLRLDNWLDAANNAGMEYMKRNVGLRHKPQLLVDRAKTVISVSLNYNYKDGPDDLDYYISKYARGVDYHLVMKSKLRQLVSKLEEVYPDMKSRVFTDSAPVLERAFSRNSGLGFIGKNTCVINHKFGSFFFLGEIICDFISDYDSPIERSCGNCTLCIDSCPVGALGEGGLDANKCISYHTIENKENIPQEIKESITNQVFGCDICQNVCPYNQKASISKHKEFSKLEKISGLNIFTLETMTNSQFNKRFSDTSLVRAGRKKLLSNFILVQSKIDS